MKIKLLENDQVVDALLDETHETACYFNPETDDFKAIRNKAKELATLIAIVVPSGREQSTALTRLEETVMHANAGIARQYPKE